MPMMQTPWLTIGVVILLVGQVTSQCSGVLSQTTSLYSTYTIQTPNYPSYYNNYDSCIWSITASTSTGKILFHIPILSIERYYDFMTLFDGSSSGSSQLFYSRYTNGNEPTSAVTTGRNAYATFTSDYSITYGGCEISYIEVDSASNACYGTYTATSTKQHAWSTSSSSFGCSFTISASGSNLVKITVLNMQSSSYLRFADSDGSSTLDIYASGTSEYVSLTSTASVQVPYGFSSFMFTYEEVSSGTNNIVSSTTVSYGTNICSGLTLYATSTLQYIASPNYPSSYNNYAYCITTITASSANKIVMLVLVDYDVNYDDYLYIYDGPSSGYTSLGSSWTTGNTVNGTGTSVFLNFVTSYTGTLRGFQLSYVEIDQVTPSCASTYTTYTATSTSQSITKGAYSNNEDVYWLIVKPSESDNLVLDVSFMSVEEASNCRYDSITFYDGACNTADVIATVCGYSPVTFEDNTGRYVLVRFKTDGSVTYSGFTLNYYIGTYVSAEASTSDDDDSDNTKIYFIIAIVALFATAVLVAAIGVFCYLRKVKRRRTAIANGTLATPKPKATKKSPQQLLSEINEKLNKDLQNQQKSKTPRLGQFEHPEPAPPGPGVKIITRTGHPIHPTPGLPPVPVIQQGPPIVPPPGPPVAPPQGPPVLPSSVDSNPAFPPSYETGGEINTGKFISPAFPPGFNPALYGKPLHIPDGTIPPPFQYISPKDARAFGLHQ